MNWKRMNKGKVLQKFSLKVSFAGKIPVPKPGFTGRAADERAA